MLFVYPPKYRLLAAGGVNVNRRTSSTLIPLPCQPLKGGTWGAQSRQKEYYMRLPSRIAVTCSSDSEFCSIARKITNRNQIKTF